MTAEDDNSQLQALQGFADAEEKELVDKLEDILSDVAKTGQYIFPWHFMKPLYYHKLDKVTTEFLNTYPPKNQDGTEDQRAMIELKDFREELLETFNKFTLAPFTLQRVTELLLQPRKHYKTTSKFFRGLGKNIMVVSTLNMAATEERNKLKRQYEDGKSDYEMPPMKRTENGSVFYSYGGPNSLNYNDINSHGYMDEEREETFADVVCDGDDVVEEQVNGYVNTASTITDSGDLHQQNTEVTGGEGIVAGEEVPATVTEEEEEADELEADLTSNESMEGS